MTPALALLGAGTVLVVVYHVLAAWGVARIGAPTDIGGGLVLLAGYVLVIAGVVVRVVGLRALPRGRRAAR